MDLDWEVLDDPTSLHNTNTNTNTNTTYLEGIEGDSEGVIRADYFSLDYHVEDATDQISIESDNPSWIDPVYYYSNSKTNPIGDLWSTDGSDGVESEASQTEPQSKIDGEKDDTVQVQGDDVWWRKLPLDLLKYCLFKASPVWRTLSVAAAVMGVVILGRTLYKLKRSKTRSLHLKLTIDDDDKKVSQLMSRAARLNEAFSVVKRAPMIRPSLPATGVAPWPVMALR